MKKDLQALKQFVYSVSKNFSTEELVQMAALGSDLEKEVAEQILFERKENSETKTIEDVISEMKELHTTMKELGLLKEDSNFEEITEKVFKEVYGMECECDECEEVVSLIPGHVYLEKNKGIEFLLAVTGYCEKLEQPMVVMIDMNNGNRLVEPMPIEMLIAFIEGGDEFDFELLGKVKTYN